LWRLELLNADATDGALSGAGALAAERASAAAAATVDHLPKRDAVAALSRASGLRPGILGRIYDHWRRKRSRRGRPLLRRLAAPTPAADTNPFHVFRPRERTNRPQTRRRREGGDDGRERLLALSANLRKSSELLELVARREAKKRALAISEAALQVLAITLRHDPAGPQRDALEADIAAAARSRPLRRPVSLEPRREINKVDDGEAAPAAKKKKKRGAGAEVVNLGPPIESSEQRRARLRKRASAARQSINAVAMMPARPPAPGEPRMLFAETELLLPRPSSSEKGGGSNRILEAVKRAVARAVEAEAAAAAAEAAAAASAASSDEEDDDDDDDDDDDESDEGEEGDDAEEMEVTRCDATDAAEDVSTAAGTSTRATRRATRGRSSEKADAEEKASTRSSAAAKASKGSKQTKGPSTATKGKSNKDKKPKKNKKLKKSKPQQPQLPQPPTPLELPPPGLPQGCIPRIGRCGRLLWLPPPPPAAAAAAAGDDDDELPPPLWAKHPAAAPDAAASNAALTPHLPPPPMLQPQRYGQARPGSVTALAQLRANAEAAAAAAVAAAEALQAARAEEAAAKAREEGKGGGAKKAAGDAEKTDEDGKEKDAKEPEEKKDEERKDDDVEMKEAQ